MQGGVMNGLALWFVGWAFTVGLRAEDKRSIGVQLVEGLMWPLLLGETVRELVINRKVDYCIALKKEKGK